MGTSGGESLAIRGVSYSHDEFRKNDASSSENPGEESGVLCFYTGSALMVWGSCIEPDDGPAK